MKKLFLLSYFTRMQVAAFIVAFKLFISKIAANVSLFSEPVPTLAEMTNTADELESLHTAASSGNKTAKANLDVKWKEALNQVRDQFGYLEFCCNSDRTKGQVLDIPMVKIRGNAPPITHVGPVTLKLGLNSGEMIVKLEAIKYRQIYLYKITSTPELPVSQWQTKASRNAKVTFENLTPGVEYTVCVEVVGKDGQSMCSLQTKLMVV